MESTLVIKVNYGDALRRFNARVNNNGELDLDMDGLRAKILGLFNFPLDAVLNLTYVDEDGDVVSLVDDEDLRDVMRQRLKFLRIDVQTDNDKSNARSTGSSTPLRSPRVQSPLQNVNAGVTELMKSVQEPLCEALSKLSHNLATKTVCSTPVIAELVNSLTKMEPLFRNLAYQPQAGAGSSSEAVGSEVPTAPTMPTSTNPTAPTMPTSTNPTAPTMHISTNAAKDDVAKEVLKECKSTSETSNMVSAENVTRGVGASAVPVSAPVDLNLPPCDSNPSGFSMNFAAAASYIPAGEHGKETKKLNASDRSGKSVHCTASANSADPWRPFAECPFSGMPMANGSAVPPTLPHVPSFRRSHWRHDAMVGMFHRGVQCDNCGVHPIVGPRYKSKVKDDYDLCSICFAEMGNEADYVKIERPLSYRHPRYLKGLHDHMDWVMKVKPSRKLDSRFISDVNVFDGSMMAPSTQFTKIWRMRNNGGVVWPQGVRLVWIGGDRFSHADSVEIEIPKDGVPVDGELDIAVDFISPELPGRYVSYWRMASPSGTKFGQRVWVLIQVDASLKNPFVGSSEGLNLNLPPECDDFKCLEIVDMNSLPVVDDGFLGASNASAPLPVNPVVDEQAKKDQELYFPINNTLLVGDDISAPAPTQTSSSVSYPIIDFSEGAPAGPSQTPLSTASTMGVGVNDTVEKTLLKELEEMGFKQVDLNKEILRMNEYNLEQSLDDLCDVAEWDPILEELNEMGFSDKEMNMKLLKKNNGSIKRVVMDLLTGEKDA